jgi:MYXO-CTERM domain-containing protein
VAGATSAAALLLLVADAAAAATPPPPTLPGNAAVDQYREGIPTGGGPVAPGSGGGRSKPLSKAVQKRLQQLGGSNGKLLSKVATSRQYGAPAASSPTGSGSKPTATGAGPSAATGGSEAAPRPVASGSGGMDWRVPLFLGALLAASALVAAVVLRRRRNSGPAT